MGRFICSSLLIYCLASAKRLPSTFVGNRLVAENLRISACDSPLKNNGSGCIIDWAPVESFLPNNWKSFNRVKNYGSLFGTGKSDMLLDKIAVSGTLEQLEHAVQIINYTDPTGTVLKRLLKTPGSSYSRPPLLRCAEDLSSGQSVEKVKFLVSVGADVEAFDEQGSRLVQVVALRGSLDVMKYVIEEFDVLEERGIYTGGEVYGRTPLQYCANDRWSGQAIEKIQYLVSKGARVSVRDANRDRLVNIAALDGTLETLKYVVENFHGLEKTGQYGRTPLLNSASDRSSGQAVEKIQYLVSKGANERYADAHGNKLVNIAGLYGTLKTLKYVVEKFHVLEETGKHGRTPLLNCVEDHSSGQAVEKIQYLVSKGANASYADANGDKLIHLAGYSGTLDRLKYVVEKFHVQVFEEPGWGGRTPLLLCAGDYWTGDAVKKIKYLLSKGANAEAKDSRKYNLLHVAAWSGTIDTTEYVGNLIKSGSLKIDLQATVDIGETIGTIPMGETALQLAKTCRHDRQLKINYLTNIYAKK